MRVLSRSGTLLLALGVILTGCYQSGNAPAKRAAAQATSSAESTPKTAALAATASREYVLTVEGMV